MGVSRGYEPRYTIGLIRGPLRVWDTPSPNP